jgi:4-hydroxybenzoate polyprenyltransferase
MDEKSFPIRIFFGALIGERALAYVLHLRPLEWPIMTVHFVMGTLLAVGLDISWCKLALGWFIFVVLVNGGTLAINSAFDQDEGDVGYLKSPPKPPKHLRHVSGAMLAAAFLLGYLLPWVFAWATAACVLMSILYSVPPARLKARAGWDLIINMLGFGLLTPLAGWGLTGQPLTPWFWKICIGFGFLFGALYPATQIYQIEEDRARGDRTLVIRLGAKVSLIVAILMVCAAHVMFSWAAGTTSDKQQMRFVPTLLLISHLLWVMTILSWAWGLRSMTQAQNEKRMYWLLAFWAITEIIILWVFWPR